ncbi:MAG: 3-phosphoshikimate 1-carboxyvinyltransferase [Tenericutes bacterium]|jgi:3-phosphoshikimate 1-carboxyvinyltransferase|nr:3-phosphoshikimate 1-carboxyvinyltransferase [Mycoplasmatota bacterium]
MDILIYPNQLKGEMTPPPSKSYLHRAIICASLTKGKSTIKNILIGDDIQKTIEAFRSLGVKIEYLDNQLIIESSGKLQFKDNHMVHCGESGSTMRFLMPILTNKKGTEFYGEESLLNRPLDLYESIFSKQKNEFVRFGDYIYTEGEFKPSEYIIEDDSSSQFISGLLFVLPLLKESSTIRLKENFQSKKYIDMTMMMLENFGIKIIKHNDSYFTIPGNQQYEPTDITIESDFSQAAFFIVGAILNGDVTIHHINKNSLQPDKEILNIIEAAGGKITYKDQAIHVQKSTINIHKIDLAQIIDLGPILFLFASQSKNKTIINHFERLIYKESDRLNNMLEILNIMNVSYQIKDKTLIIDYQENFTLNNVVSYNDHRIAMAIAIMATLADTPTVIKNMQVINKSYPTFLNDLENLEIKVEYLS